MIVLDCCTKKKVVGYAIAGHMRTSLVCEAICMAVRRCLVEKGGGDLLSAQAEAVSTRLRSSWTICGCTEFAHQWDVEGTLSGCVGFSHSMPR